MIRKGSRVYITKSNEQGTVLEIRDDFVKVKTSNNEQWCPVSDITVSDNLFLNKYLRGKFDSLHDFVLTADSHRLDVAHMWDPLVLASATRVDLYPHQLNAVVWILNNFRVMIADEVGLGKTITALLAIYELRVARKVLDRVLYVVPSPLVIKWQNELQKRFNMASTILNKEYLHSNPDAFSKDNYSYITSIDFLKRDQNLKLIPSNNIDCVVVDEAHKAKFGNDRYKLVKKLSGATTRLIFLTATPHDGNDEHFLSLMRLLDYSVESSKMTRPLMCRNIKENVIDISGQKIFPPRKSSTIKIEIDYDEGEIHRSLEHYLTQCQNSAQNQKERSAMRFVSIIFRKRAASSLYSLRQSLTRRHDRLGTISVDDTLKSIQKIKAMDDDLDDTEHDNFDTEFYTSRANIKQEKSEINKLIQLLDKLGTKDSKLTRLMAMIEALRQNDKNAQLVIFTEYRSTLDYLLTKLTQYDVAKIDGTMHMHDRETMLEKFKKHEIDILICTDAAGEGIDMQFCNMEINYDIPWNPNRLEQRMGRIHRIGQTRHVAYYNFVLSGEQIGADGYVHQLLLSKLENIKTAFDDGVYDLLGEMYSHDEFATVCEKLVNLPRQHWAKSAGSFVEDAAAKLYQARQNRDRLLGSSVLNEFTPDTITSSKKTSVDAFDIKRFLETFVHLNEGSISPYSTDIYRIVLSQSLGQTLEIGVLTGTYNRELADSTGHQYFALGDRNIDKILHHAMSNRPMSLISHPTRKGMLFVYRISIFDGVNELRDEQIAMVYCPEDGDSIEVDVKSVWDYSALEPSDEPAVLPPQLSMPNIKIEEIALKFKEDTDSKLKTHIENVKRFVTSELSAKITSLDKDISSLENQKNPDPSILEVIRVRKRKKKSVSANWEKRMSEMKQLANSFFSYDLLATAIIVPDSEIRQNLLVEYAGMQAVLNYERKRVPIDTHNSIVDVSDRSCGYDIESSDGRHIEVKSFSTTGDPSLTSHEWDMARRHRNDYWLYIVENATSVPIIHERQNPYDLYKDKVEHRSATSDRWIIKEWKYTESGL